MPDDDKRPTPVEFFVQAMMLHPKPESAEELIALTGEFVAWSLSQPRHSTLLSDRIVIRTPDG
jgi:hypothetical protein